jgi:hypothetical protein
MSNFSTLLSFRSGPKAMYLAVINFLICYSQREIFSETETTGTPALAGDI